MILMRLIAWLRDRRVLPNRDGRAALVHLVVLGLALTLVAQGERARLALSASPAVAALEPSG